MNTNAAHQIPVHRQRRRISRQEMLRRKRAIRRRKRIARFFRISVAVLLLLTAVSFWQDYGGEILPTVNHLYYQLTARYDLPVSKYDFAALSIIKLLSAALRLPEKGHKKRRSVFDNCRGHKSPRCVISAARRYSVVRVRLPAAIRARSRGAYHVARVYYFYFKLPPFQKAVCRQA